MIPRTISTDRYEEKFVQQRIKSGKLGGFSFRKLNTSSKESHKKHTICPFPLPTAGGALGMHDQLHPPVRYQALADLPVHHH
jgi:hypothetical protein